MSTSIQSVENHLSIDEAKWFAIYTRYKAEKDVVKRLSIAGIEAYCPINKKVRQYARKRRIVEMPLINCYAFVKIRKPQYIPVLETMHVIKFIKFSENLISISQWEIDLLKRICQENLDVLVAPTEFYHGQQVEIIGGSLTGIKGKLIENKGKNFVVQLDRLGFGLHIELDPRHMRAIGPKAVVEVEVDEKLW